MGTTEGSAGNTHAALGVSGGATIRTLAPSATQPSAHRPLCELCRQYGIRVGTGGMNEKSSYAALRVAHVHAVRAALEDHVTRVDWPADRIERYRTERLRALLSYARSHSPFHAARMKGFDPASATVADLARLPPMVKQEAQDEWDAIVTEPGLDRAEAERIAGRADVVLLYVVRLPGVQLRRIQRRSWAVRVVLGAVRDARVFGVADAGARRAQATRRGRAARPDASCRARGRRTAAREYPSVRRGDRPPDGDGGHPSGCSVRAGAGRVAAVMPTHLVGYASVIGRLARASIAGELDIRPVRG